MGTMASQWAHEGSAAQWADDALVGRADLIGELSLLAENAREGSGSLVLLTGEAASRRPILAASRVVVEVDRTTIVAFPHNLRDYLGDGDALILTGASRTADVEKILVRGIHGAEEMVVVLGGEG